MYNYMDVVNITDTHEIVNLGPCPCEGPCERGVGKAAMGERAQEGQGEMARKMKMKRWYSKASHAVYYFSYSCKIIYIK